MTASPRYSPMDRRAVVPGELLLHKIEEVNRSVKVHDAPLTFYYVVINMHAHWLLLEIHLNLGFQMLCSNAI